MPVVRTRAQWARRINKAHKAVVGVCPSNFLKLGRELLAAKRALPHGEFTPMIERDLNFTARTAQTLMRVVSDKRLAKNEAASHLPKALTVLHELTRLPDELTRLPDEAIDRGISAGIIHPEMSRSAAKKFVTITHKAEPARLFTLVPRSSNEDREQQAVAAPPLLLVEKLEALEKLATDLSIAMQRRGVVDTDSVRRIRTVAEKLLSLIEHPIVPAMLQ
jgi:hypothetical protein